MKLLVILFAAPCLYGQSISIGSIQTTSMQATVRYTVPPAVTTGVCSMKAADMNRGIVISSSTWAANVATITAGAPHGLLSGTVIRIEQSGVSAWDGWQTITGVPSSNTFTFATATNASSSAGNIGVLVNDVNASLGGAFSGADQDNRAGNTSRGSSRSFVLGFRSSAVAADGFSYSRSLQVNSRHHVTLTCGASVAEHDFRTQNIPAGNTYNSGPPVSTVTPGQYSYPNVQWSNPAQALIDPVTGIRSTRATVLTGTASASQNFINAPSAPNWGNPTGPLTSGTATYVGGACGGGPGPQCALFLRADSLVISGGASYASETALPQGSLDWFQLKPTAASISNGSCAGDDCKIVSCLTINGVNCASGTKEQALTATPSPYTIGTRALMDLWQSTGPALFSRVESSTASGRITYVASTKVVTWSAGSVFGLRWTAGSSMIIDGTPYPIASVQNENQVTLASGPAADQFSQVYSVTLHNNSTGTGYTNHDPMIFTGGGCTTTPAGTINVTGGSITSTTMTNFGNGCTGTPVVTVTSGGTGQSLDANVGGAPYSAPNFGVLIWKKTATADTVSIGPTTYLYGSSTMPQWPASSHNPASPVVLDSNGKPGYNLFIGDEWYWVATDGSESRDLGLLATSFYGPFFYFQEGSSFATVGTMDEVAYPWDPTDPDTVWSMKSVYYVTPDTRYTGFVKAKYVGDHQATAAPGVKIKDCNLTTPANTPPCIVFTVMQPKTDGSDALVNAAPLFNPAYVTNPTFPGNNWKWAGVSPDGDIAVFDAGGGQDWAGWMFIYTIGNGQPVGSGPGSMSLIAGASSYIKAPCSWCSIHDFFPPDAGWGSIASNDLLADGPKGTYTMTLTGATLNTTPGNPRGLNTCPSGTPYDLTGASCTSITVTGPPVSAFDGSVLQNEQVGDIMSMEVPGFVEHMRIVSMSSTTSFIVQRGYPGSPEFPAPTSHASMTFYMLCGTRNNHNTAVGLWNYRADPFGLNSGWTTVVNDPVQIQSHGNQTGGIPSPPVTINAGSPFSGLPTSICPTGASCNQSRLGYFSTSLNSPQMGVNANPAFGGLTGIGTPNQVDSHPGPCFGTWCFDARPMLGGDANTVNPLAHPFVKVSGQLWKAAAATIPNPLHRKILPTLAYVGRNSLLDISGPSSVIGDTSADAFKYCVPNAVNECVTGSAIGDVYVNAPYVAYPYCRSPQIAVPVDNTTSICVGDLGAYTGNLEQIGTTQDISGVTTRNLGPNYSKWNQQYVFWNNSGLPGGLGSLEYIRWMDGVSMIDVGMVVPPFPLWDGVNRSTFEPITIALSPPSGLSVATAAIEFGYAENGSPLNCTLRQESCVAVASTIDAAAPFYFETTETYTRASCASGCTISIPALSQRVLYYQWVFYDGSGSKVSASGMQVVATP